MLDLGAMPNGDIQADHEVLAYCALLETSHEPCSTLCCHTVYFSWSMSTHQLQKAYEYSTRRVTTHANISTQ